MLRYFARFTHVKPGLKTTRIEAFSDSIFAFAITLLVLNLTVPELTRVQLANNGLFKHLLSQWHIFVIYAFSFSIIGIFWIGHSIMFHYIHRADRKLMWLNSLLLLCIGFMPFATNLLGRYFLDRVAVIVYGGALMCAGLLYILIWAHATGDKLLVSPMLSEKIIKKGFAIVSFAPMIYVCAIALSFIDIRISLGIYAIVPILYIIPSPVDELVQEVAGDVT